MAGHTTLVPVCSAGYATAGVLNALTEMPITGKKTVKSRKLRKSYQARRRESELVIFELAITRESRLELGQRGVEL